MLLAHVLDQPRSYLLAHDDETPDAAARAAFAQLVARRATGEPVAYLLGQREFFGLAFAVDARVLVPRPETELLVTQALTCAAQFPPDVRIADIGTGSGAIAVALAVHLPRARIYATDLAPAALDVAAQNARHHRVTARITLLQGDLLAPLPEPVHLLVSNPPYTILSEIAANVAAHEPHLALDGGADGLAVYRRLVAQAPAALLPGGVVLCEIGATQGAAVAALARQAFPPASITVQRDLAGHERVVMVETAA